MTNRRFPIDPYRPAQPTRRAQPTVRPSRISLPGYTEAERAIAEQKRKQLMISRTALALSEGILRKKDTGEKGDIADKYTTPTTTQPTITVEQAAQDFKDAQNAYIKPVKPGYESKELVKTTSPGFFRKALGVIDAYEKNVARPLQAPLYWALIQKEKGMRALNSLKGATYTEEEKQQLQVAENALEKYMGETYLKKGLPLAIGWQSRSDLSREEGKELLETAWNSNPLPKFELGLLEVVADPLNIIPGAIVAKALKNGVKYGFVGPKIAGSVLGKYGKRLFTKEEALDDVVQVDEKGLLDSNDPFRGLRPEEMVTQQEKVQSEILREADELKNTASDMSHPMRDPTEMSKLQYWTRNTAVPKMKHLYTVTFNPFTVIHKYNKQRKMQKAFDMDVASGSDTNEVLSKQFDAFIRADEDVGGRVAKVFELDDKGFLTTNVSDTMQAGMIKAKPAEFWNDYLGTQVYTKKGKPRTRTLKDGTVVPLRTGGTLRNQITDARKAKNTELTNELQGELDALEGMAAKGRYQFADVMEWQNFFEFTPKQLDAVTEYNRNYLPWVQDNLRRAGNVQDAFINETTLRRYFPRVVQKAGQPLAIQGMRMGGKRFQAIHSRVNDSSIQEGLSRGVNYVTDPAAAMKQQADNYVRVKAESQLADMFETSIQGAIKRTLDIVATSPKAIVMAGPMARVLKSAARAEDKALFKGRKDVLTAEDVQNLIKRGDIEPMEDMAFEIDRLAKLGVQHTAAQDVIGKAIAFGKQANLEPNRLASHFEKFSTATTLNLSKSQVDYFATQYPGVGFKIISRLLDEVVDEVIDPKTGKVLTRTILKKEGVIDRGMLTAEDLADLDKAYSKLTHMSYDDTIRSTHSVGRQIKLRETLKKQGDIALSNGLKFGNNLRKVIDQQVKQNPDQILHMRGFNVSANGVVTPTFGTVAREVAMKPFLVMQNVAQVLRYWGTGYDAGWPMIQGMYLLTQGPAGAKAYGRIWVEFAKAISDPNWRGFTAKLYAKERDLVKLALEDRLILETTAEQTDAIMSTSRFVRGIAKKTQQAVAIPSKVKVGGRALSIQNMPVLFQESGNYARLMLYKAHLPRAHKQALKRMKMTEKQFQAAQNNPEVMTRYNELARKYRAEIADHANKTTGVINMAQYGLSAERKAIESSLLFAPRFVRSQISLMADIMKGDLKGELARESVAKLVASGTIFYTAICLATGQEPKLNPLPKSQGGDGGQFMSWEVPGMDRRLSIGGTMMTALKFGARMIAAGKNGDALDEEFDKDWTEWSWTKFVTNKMSPSLGAAKTILTGQTYGGHQLEWKGDGWGDSLGKSVSSMTTLANEGLTPFWTVALLDGPPGSWGSRATGAAAEFMGFQSYPESPWTVVEEIQTRLARERGVDTWDQLDRDQQRILRQENPDLVTVEDMADQQKWFTYPKNAEKQELEDMFNEMEELTTEKRLDQSNRLSSFLNKRPDIAGRRTIQDINGKFAQEYDKVIEKYPLGMAFLDGAVNPEDRIPHFESARMAYIRLILANPDLYDENAPEGEEYDYDLRNVLEEGFIAKYGTEAINYIERSWVSTHSEEDPLAVEYHMVMRELRPYFALEKTIVDNGYEQGMGVNWEMYKEWKKTRDDSFYEPTAVAQMKRVQSIVTRAKQMYRDQNADKEHMLYRWGFVNTLRHPENIAVGTQQLGKTNSIDDYDEILEQLSVKRKLDNNEDVL